MKTRYNLRARVWLYPSSVAAWHFLTLPKEQSADIKKRFGPMAKGWGSLPVTVTIGKTTWRTSIFPDKRSGGYILPLKADVRKKEKIVRDNEIAFSLAIEV